MEAGMDSHNVNNVRGFEGGNIFAGLADLIATYTQLSHLSAALFAPIAKVYVGTAIAREHEKFDAIDVVNLALHKLAFEAGEHFRVQFATGDDKQAQKFERDEQGVFPDLKFAHLASALMAYAATSQKQKQARDEKAAKRAAQQAAAPQVMVNYPLSTYRVLARGLRFASTNLGAPAMTANVAGMRSGAVNLGQPAMTATIGPQYVSSAKSGCGCGGRCGCGGGCGGGCGCTGGTATPPSAVPCYDPCAGGLTHVPPAPDPCTPVACPPCPTTPEDCDDLCTISCETKLALRDCVKQLLCDLILIFQNMLLKQPSPLTFQDIIKRFLDCVREALCPTDKPCLPAPTPIPCLPCDYAVETK
jgi:hypothetical protein